MGDGLRRAAAQRVVVHLGALAAVTGLALFFVGGVRDPGSWVFFGLASFIGIAALARVLQGRERSEGDSLAVERTVPSKEPGRVDERPSGTFSEPSPDPDEIDYLRALRHELRTPLNAVLGFSDVLLSGIDGEINESQREDLEIIRASGIRLRVLLDSALDISQLVEGSLRLDADRVDIRELVDRAAKEARQLWSNKRAPTCDLPESPCIVQVDEARLRRSVLVLADFLATSHRDAEIGMTLSESDGYLAIEVCAASTQRPSLEALPTTAEVLAAEDMSTIRQWPVAVTSELIGRHGGSLYHGSSPSRFLVRLPIRGSA